MWSFEGQHALVTGGASGIGRAIAISLAERGASVSVADRNLGGAKDVAGAISVAGGNATPIEVDVVDAPSVSAAVETAIATYGPINALTHSAGIGAEIEFLETSLADWKRMIDIDLTGTFLVCQTVANSMRDNRYGRIVVLSSTAGLRGGTGRAAYGAAKAGVIGLTNVMAVELAPFGITANALAPGAIETDLVSRMHDENTRITYRRGIPVDRYGTVEEVAATALFLMSKEASYVNGAVMAVDGGFLAAGVMKRPD